MATDRERDLAYGGCYLGLLAGMISGIILGIVAYKFFI